MVAISMDDSESKIGNDEGQKKHGHGNFAGRMPAGTAQAVTVAKNGQRHIQVLPDGTRREILSVGLACSECFSGPNLARLLRPGFEYEMRAMESMSRGDFSAPLSIHTSSGVPEALDDFVDALRPHLPWKFGEGGEESAGEEEEDDWLVSLQIEGASAVWAAVDMLLQVEILRTGNRHRKMVAVGARSYHGPPATSFGGRSPLWNKSYQVKYPVPSAGQPIDSEELLSDFSAFLEKHGDEVGVMLIEPQWGSSQTGLPWPRTLLKQYIVMAKSYGIKILCDEIMCGLGRHGRGTLFLSDAWELDPDAVTFGKSVGGGVFPLSGAVIKEGKGTLREHGRSVMQSHTFAASSTRALMAGAAILNELPKWFSSIAKLGEEMSHIFRYLQSLSRGMIVAQGHGLMWGCLFTSEGPNADERSRAETVVCFKGHCETLGILPYFVPVGGFMVTPVVDVDVGTVYEIGVRLEEALRRTMEDRGWMMNEEGGRQEGLELEVENAADEASPVVADKFVDKEVSPVALQTGADKAKQGMNAGGVCSTQFHATRSCTSCTNFVCRDVRMRFLPTM